MLPHHQYSTWQTEVESKQTDLQPAWSCCTCGSHDSASGFSPPEYSWPWMPSGSHASASLWRKKPSSPRAHTHSHRMLVVYTFMFCKHFFVIVDIWFEFYDTSKTTISNWTSWIFIHSIFSTCTKHFLSVCTSYPHCWRKLCCFFTSCSKNRNITHHLLYFWLESHLYQALHG